MPNFSEDAKPEEDSELPIIDSPEALKALPEEDLPRLAEKIRATLIECLSKTGGHLGPNLGVVELTLAMHRVFETPKDSSSSTSATRDTSTRC